MDHVGLFHLLELLKESILSRQELSFHFLSSSLSTALEENGETMDVMVASSTMRSITGKLTSPKPKQIIRTQELTAIANMMPPKLLASKLPAICLVFKKTLIP